MSTRAASTLDEFCDEHRISRDAAYKEMHAGRLRAVKFGGKTLILRDDALAWAAKLPEWQRSSPNHNRRRRRQVQPDCSGPDPQ